MRKLLLKGIVTFAASCMLSSLTCAAALENDPVLIKTDKIEVRKSDYDAALLLLPESERLQFSFNHQNVLRTLADILRGKTLAARAQKDGVAADPKAQAMIKVNTMRIYAQLERDKIMLDAEKKFESDKANFEARAKEVYLVDREKYKKPEEVKASHILFSSKKYSDEDGLKKAQEIRTQLLTGADFTEMVKQESDEPSAETRLGELGWFTADKMVPSFSKAAFALKKDGEISEPVKTQFGWHLIRLEGKKEAQLMPFDEAKPILMEELKQQFVQKQRDDAMLAIDNDPSAKLNNEEIDKLMIAPLNAKAIENQSKVVK